MKKKITGTIFLLLLALSAIISIEHAAQAQLGQTRFLCAGGGATSTPCPTSTPTPTPTPAAVATATCLSVGTNVTCTNPTGLSSGQVIFAALMGSGNTFTTPTGWSLEWGGMADGNGGFAALFRRIYQSGDSSTTVFNGVGNGAAICMQAWSGLSYNPDTYLNPPSADGSSTAPSITGSTTTINNDLIANVVGFEGTTSFTAASGYTAGCNIAAVGGTNYGVALETKLLGTAGAIGTITGSLGTSEKWTSGVFSFAP